MSLRVYREVYKPFEYDWAFNYYLTTLNSTWSPLAIDMSGDIHDFETSTTEDEKEIISGVTKGFVTMESHIHDYWINVVCKAFPKHEIVAAATMIAAMEQVHKHAYAHFSDSIGVSDYRAILSDDKIRQKLGHFIDKKDIKVSLATFSGVGEGVSLYSSFAILLSFCLGKYGGRFKGLNDIISYSVRDESLHSEFGCRLFKVLVEEEGLQEYQKDMIYDAFDIGLENEFQVIDRIFKGREVKTIDSEDLKNFMRKRANNRLVLLGLDPSYEEQETEVEKWFNIAVGGQTSNDFFVHAADGSYTTILSSDYASVDYSLSLDV